MKVLVTGASGQVGSALAEAEGAYPNLNLVFADRAMIDLAQPGSASRVVGELKPDAIVNAAAYTAVDRAEGEPEVVHRVNAAAAGELAEAAARLDVPIIQISTDYVFDGRAQGPYPEDAATNPLNVYGRTKLDGEKAVVAANPRHMIIRTSWVHSPFGSNFVRTMLRLASDRDVIRVVGDQVGSPTSAAALADAILDLLGRWADGDRAGEGATFHLAGSGACSWAEFASAIFELSSEHGGPSAAVVPIATSDYPTPARRPAHAVLDCTKIADELGIRLPHWRDSLDPIVRRLVDAA